MSKCDHCFYWTPEHGCEYDGEEGLEKCYMDEKGFKMNFKRGVQIE